MFWINGAFFNINIFKHKLQIHEVKHTLIPLIEIEI